MFLVNRPVGFVAESTHDIDRRKSFDILDARTESTFASRRSPGGFLRLHPLTPCVACSTMSENEEAVEASDNETKAEPNGTHDEKPSHEDAIQATYLRQALSQEREGAKKLAERVRELEALVEEKSFRSEQRVARFDQPPMLEGLAPLPQMLLFDDDANGNRPVCGAALHTHDLGLGLLVVIMKVRDPVKVRRIPDGEIVEVPGRTNIAVPLISDLASIPVKMAEDVDRTLEVEFVLIEKREISAGVVVPRFRVGHRWLEGKPQDLMGG